MAQSGLAGFRWGAGFVLRGVRFLAQRPSLYPWAIAPVLLTIGLVVWAWFLSWEWTPWLLNLLWARPGPGFLQNVWNGLAFFLVLWAFATAAIVLYGLVGAFGAPFYDRLSLAVEQELDAELPEMSWSEELAAVGHSIGHSLLSVGLWVLVMAGLFLLELIPVVGTLLELVGSVVATGFFLAREMLDGPLSRRGLSYGAKLAYVRERPAVMLGFGLAAAGLLLIPLVNILILPSAVVGGTLLYLELERGRSLHLHLESEEIPTPPIS